tara:strand:- start:26 stop:235 length:210 start_codon:yes stop_codon:yes gene_type:complete
MKTQKIKITPKAKILDIEPSYNIPSTKKYGLFVFSTKEDYINQFICFSDNKNNLIEFAKGSYTIIGTQK